MRPREASVWLIVAGTVTFLATGRLEGAVRFAWLSSMHLLPLVVAWPIAYILIRAIHSQATAGRSS
jgi:hypothetical protein